MLFVGQMLLVFALTELVGYAGSGRVTGMANIVIAQ